MATKEAPPRTAYGGDYDNGKRKPSGISARSLELSKTIILTITLVAIVLLLVALVAMNAVSVSKLVSGILSVNVTDPVALDGPIYWNGQAGLLLTETAQQYDFTAGLTNTPFPPGTYSILFITTISSNATVALIANPVVTYWMYCFNTTFRPAATLDTMPDIPPGPIPPAIGGPWLVESGGVTATYAPGTILSSRTTITWTVTPEQQKCGIAVNIINTQPGAGIVAGMNFNARPAFY